MSEHSTKKKKEKVVPAYVEASLIISLKEARKIIGVDARTLSDDELMVAILQLTELASDLLKSSNISLEKQL